MSPPQALEVRTAPAGPAPPTVAEEGRQDVLCAHLAAALLVADSSPCPATTRFQGDCC